MKEDFLKATKDYFNKDVTLETRIGSVIMDSSDYISYIMYIENKLSIAIPDDIAIKAKVFRDLYKNARKR